MKRQQRLTFARVGVIDPLAVRDHTSYGGNVGLRQALRLEPAEVVEAVVDSGLRGRGGAGFPTGIKWRTVLEADRGHRSVVARRLPAPRRRRRTGSRT
jgi:formate dehydrogenase iron-sulfur subunit